MRTLLLSVFFTLSLFGQINIGGNRYGTVQDDGTPVAQRAVINFIGADVSCVDNSGAAKTDCTITGGGSTYPLAENAVATATYTLLTSDCGKMVVMTFAGATTVTVPAASGFANTCEIQVMPTGGNAALITGVSATVYDDQTAVLRGNATVWRMDYLQFTSSASGAIAPVRATDGTTNFELDQTIDYSLTGNNSVNVGTTGGLRFKGTNNATGTVVNRLVKLAAANTLTVAAVSETDEPLGVCIGGCGNAGTADVVFRGNVVVEADNTVSANDWITFGTTTAGRALSAGVTEPTSGWILGRARTGASAGSTFTLLLQPRKVTAASGFDPFDFTTMKIQDRFCGTSSVGGPTFDVGQYRWRSDALAGVSTLTLATDVNHPCYWQIVTGAVSGNGTAVSPVSFTSQPHFGFAYGSDGTWEMRLLIRIDTIATMDFAFGVQVTPGADITTTGSNVIRVKRLSGGTTFVFEACDGASVCSSSNSTITPADATTYTLRMRSTTSGTILFSVNGETEVSRAVNIPTVTLYPSAAIKTATTATRQLRLFGWSFQKTGMTP